MERGEAPLFEVQDKACKKRYFVLAVKDIIICNTNHYWAPLRMIFHMNSYCGFVL